MYVYIYIYIYIYEYVVAFTPQMTFCNVCACSVGGFLHSNIIYHHLVDHYIPFLPLELKHVRQCVMAEMVHLNMTQDVDLADKVARSLPFFPGEEKIFAVKGCKSVRQKLVLYAD